MHRFARRCPSASRTPGHPITGPADPLSPPLSLVPNPPDRVE